MAKKDRIDAEWIILHPSYLDFERDLGARRAFESLIHEEIVVLPVHDLVFR